MLGVSLRPSTCNGQITRAKRTSCYQRTAHHGSTCPTASRGRLGASARRPTCRARRRRPRPPRRARAAAARRPRPPRSRSRRAPPRPPCPWRAWRPGARATWAAPRTACWPARTSACRRSWPRAPRATVRSLLAAQPCFLVRSAHRAAARQQHSVCAQLRVCGRQDQRALGPDVNPCMIFLQVLSE
jgi:hypothetical protein